MIAIYARQSVDKKDSISIETQIETCKRQLTPDEDNQIRIYYDKGYSGKNTDRPEFQHMMNDMKKKLISKIIVYKVDRISRSMHDFVEMREEFNKFGVEFVSCLEKFDTSTATGKAMLSIIVVFAEMERETIQKRITDNYYSRGENGYYLGGYAPFGYQKVSTQLNNKKTYTFTPIDKEVTIVNQIYEDFAYKNNSLAQIARTLNENNIITRKEKSWNPSSVSRILKNPVYVKANANVYNFLKEKGATINNSIEDFIGINGCYLYGNAHIRKGNKFVSLSTDFVTLGLHKGIVSSDLWLSAQYKFQEKEKTSNLGTGTLSWLQGLVRCKCCHYSCYVKKHKNKSNKVYLYFYCRGKRMGTCKASKKMMPTSKVENFAQQYIFEQVKELSTLKQENVVIKSEYDEKINKLVLDVQEIDKKIANLVAQISNGNITVTNYINQEIERLDKIKLNYNNKISEFEIKKNRKSSLKLNLTDIIDNWNNYNKNKKLNIAKYFIKNIYIDGLDIQIEEMR